MRHVRYVYTNLQWEPRLLKRITTPHLDEIEKFHSLPKGHLQLPCSGGHRRYRYIRADLRCKLAHPSGRCASLHPEIVIQQINGWFVRPSQTQMNEKCGLGNLVGDDPRQLGQAGQHLLREIQMRDVVFEKQHLVLRVLVTHLAESSYKMPLKCC